MWCDDTSLSIALACMHILRTFAEASVLLWLQARGLATGGGGYVCAICAAAEVSRGSPGE
jgi:hypothetical protein